MTPTALSILTTTFAEGAERNKALGIWAAIGGIGATAAWLVGGPITDGLGWEWIFFINVPVARRRRGAQPGAAAREPRPRAPAAVRRRRRGDDHRRARGARLRRRRGPDAGWADGQTLGLLAVSAALLALFVAIEARSAAPLAPLRVFRSRALVGGNLVLFALGMLAFGMPFILTQYAQEVLRWSPLEFGLASVVMPVTAAIGSIAGQAIATRGGLRSIAAAGMALTGLGCLLPDPGVGRRQLSRRHLLRAARLRPRARGGVRRRLDRLARRGRRGRGRAGLGAQQLLVPDRRGRRRRDPLDRRRVPGRGPTRSSRSPTASRPRSRPRSSSPRSGCSRPSRSSASSASAARPPSPNPPPQRSTRGGRAR